MIPILDLKEQYLSIKSEIDRAVEDVMLGGHFILGPQTQALEKEVAAYVRSPFGIAVNSGTDALHLALRALDIGPGDEVITVPFTFVATTEAIGIVGATPVFVDIDPDTFNIDAAKLEKAITPRTKAVMPVHLYGYPAPMPEIMEIAGRHGVAVVEDCAQSIGATIDGRPTGSFGAFGCFSFFPSKNLGAYGDGGLVTTDTAERADRLRSLRAHGGRVKYHHEELGVNSRLDEMQAAILRVKLPHLDQWISKRRAVADHYAEHLEGVRGVTVPREKSGYRHAYHQFTVRVDDRDAVRGKLAEAGIQTMVYYPVPLHLQKVHAGLGLPAGSFPHSERAASEVLSLPMYPELAREAQDRVIEAVRLAVGEAVNA